jgi:CRP/FNR family transcriptional regulator, transcriptional activator FtrB
MITRDLDADRIRSVRLFKQLSDSHFRALLQSASMRDAPRRSILFKEGSRPKMLYTLLGGAVELFSEHREKHRTVAIIRSIKPCMLASIWQDRNSLSARALASSQLLLVPARLLHDFMGTDVGFACAASAQVADECHDVVEQLKNTSLRTAAQRLAYWMLCFDRDSGGHGQFILPCNKRTFASYLGMAPEHLSRNLSALAPAGLLVRGRRVALKNRAALAAVAGLGPSTSQWE